MKRNGCISSDCYKIAEKDNGKSIFEYGYKKYTGFLYPKIKTRNSDPEETLYRISICGLDSRKGYYMEHYSVSVDEFLEMFFGYYDPKDKAEIIKEFEAIAEEVRNRSGLYNDKHDRFGLIDDAKAVGVPKGRTWRKHLGNLKSVVKII